MTYENPLPGNQLRQVEFDETYEGGTTRRETWYPGCAGEPNAITSEVIVKDGPYHRRKAVHDTLGIAPTIHSGPPELFEPIHRPVLDIDFPAKLIPSGTPGHFHLYLDKELPWTTYTALLEALGEAGILEEGYVRASIARGYTCLRLPGVSKNVEGEN